MGEPESLRSFATFRTRLETVTPEPDGARPATPEPPGATVAEFLVGRLRLAGFVVMDERPFEDYCRMIDCAWEKDGFEIRVGYVGDQPQEWLITIDSSHGLIARLFGRRDDGSRRRLARAVDDALREDSAACCEIRWYTPEEWDGGGNAWAEHPVSSCVTEA